MSPFIRALYDTRLIAIKLHHHEVHPRHILLGLLAQENTAWVIISKNLAGTGQNIGTLREQTRSSLYSLRHSGTVHNIDSIRFSKEGKRVSDMAIARAKADGYKDTGCEHLLLALLYERGKVQRLLESHRITREYVEHELNCIYAF